MVEKLNTTKTNRNTGFPAIENTPGLVARNIVVNGHRTTVKLEPLLWDALTDIATQENLSINRIVSKIEDFRSDSQSRTSAIRAFILSYYLISSRNRPFSDGTVKALWPRVLTTVFNGAKDEGAKDEG